MKRFALFLLAVLCTQSAAAFTPLLKKLLGPPRTRASAKQYAVQALSSSKLFTKDAPSSLDAEAVDIEVRCLDSSQDTPKSLSAFAFSA